ncbi:predicted pyridoxal phosphate-dependent enzyme apparently involved in regulation of cell wall biogenesis [Hahella chejuensis KCTC 2396]|uniref:Predicted pyridoxal phosphate-dependent enzyme apparently involved in regulation of cell wall biogenesis n=1 Tax=Hahella chejuensis (strain KCTC 2396) TaxID=349521 RepID=Q2SIJ3_HAHCH|nr:DegT/DnrJ/EryC1/StrS family aminotransferase [Hahella chejuensis]ABC29531.1 predicted pyridoxal phosphate-dependent enzyme apparently involved in regulation of cell wall biogenesis [Hahella chejuensis KCTC 2396]
MLAKIRPVGAKVYQSQDVPADISWKTNYQYIYTNSGTAALSLAVAAAMREKAASIIDVPEVILPAYACPDLVAALMAQGASPVLVDLEADSFFLDLEKLQAAISANTVAIVAVNFLGMYERLLQLRKVADARGVLLIEDSAQAPLPISANEGCADFAILSYGRGKPVNLMGGGALLFKPTYAASVSDIVANLRSSRIVVDWVWKLKAFVVNTLIMRYPYGLLERLPFLNIGATQYHPLQSIELREGLDPLVSEGIKHFYMLRADKAAAYRQGLAGIEDIGWTLLASGDGCVDEGSAQRGLLRFPILAPSRAARDHLEIELNRRGYGANAFYRFPLHRIEGVKSRVKNGDADFPIASTFADRLLTLPCHEGITDDEVADVIAIVKAAAKLDC